MKRLTTILSVLLCSVWASATPVNPADVTYGVRWCKGLITPDCVMATLNSANPLNSYAGVWNLSESGSTITAELVSGFTPDGNAWWLQFMLPSTVYVDSYEVHAINGLLLGTAWGYGPHAFSLQYDTYSISPGMTYSLELKLSGTTSPPVVTEPSSALLASIGFVVLPALRRWIRRRKT